MARLLLYQKGQEEGEGMGRAIKGRKKKGKTGAAGVMEEVPDDIGVEINLSKMREGGGEKQGGGALRRWKAEGRKA